MIPGMATPKTSSTKQKARKKQPSSVRHTPAIQRDRSKRPTVAPAAPQVEARLTELIHPATFAQVAAFHALGLRARILTLPVMVAFVLSLIWRHLGSVTEAVRVLQAEGLLWVQPTTVSPQALTQRLGTLPAPLFAGVFQEVLPQLHQRWQARQRPVPPALAWAQRHFTAVLALDGSTLDTLLCKTGLLRGTEGTVLAGRMAALLDVVSHLPHQLWFEDDSRAHDQRFWARVVATLERGMLVIFDLGFLNYAHYDDLTAHEGSFITRAADNMAYRVARVLQATADLHDLIIWVGSGTDSCCRHPLRLVEWRHQGHWYRYLTNVLDPTVLPAPYVVALYYQRWRIEDAINLVKRLLGLAYFWTGSSNGVQVQVWATWLLYAVLVDLTDAVAEALDVPFQEVSVEMVYRGLYHFTQAYHRGEADDPVAYLAAKAKLLGILKRKRKRRSSPSELLNLTIPPDP
jgi:Transposase DDE domain